MAVSLARSFRRSAWALLPMCSRLPHVSRRYVQEETGVEPGEEKCAGDEASGSESSLPKPNLANRYNGISSCSFNEKTVSVLLCAVKEEDVEIKPDGLIYLPEIKYRRILNQAFGPGGWALMPHGDSMHFQDESDGAQLVTREYSLHCQGRFVAQAIGEHTFYGKSNLNYGKACESAKSNALMRCCKDLGIASELWDPQFINMWKKKYAEEVWCVNLKTKDKKRLWRKKNNIKEPFLYPWKEIAEP